MSQPAPVTVVIPAYNAAEYLAEAIESVHRQTLPVAEVVVVDDGSTDDTAAIAEGLGARVIRQPNRGLPAARNAGIRAAGQPWIALLDSDDLWEAEKMERQWSALQLCPEAQVACCDHLQFRDGEVIRPSFLSLPEIDYLRRERSRPREDVGYFPRIDESFWGVGNFLTPSTMVLRRDLLIAVGLFDESLRYNEDCECFLRVLSRSPLVVVERPLMRYRVHDKNHSKNELEMLLAFIHIAEGMIAHPGRYPPGAGAAWGATLGPKQAEAGRLLLQAGRPEQARAMLRQSLRRGGSARALALWLATWLGPATFGRLLRAKRSFAGR